METPESKNKTRLLLLGTLFATILLSIPFAMKVVGEMQAQEQKERDDNNRRQSLSSISYAVAQHARNHDYTLPASLEELGDLSTAGFVQPDFPKEEWPTYTRAGDGSSFSLCVTLTSGFEECLEGYAPERPKIFEQSTKETTTEKPPQPVQFLRGLFSNPERGVGISVPSTWTMDPTSSQYSATFFAPGKEASVLMWMSSVSGEFELSSYSSMSISRLKNQVKNFAIVSEKTGELLGVPTYEVDYRWTGTNGVEARSILVGLVEDGNLIEITGTSAVANFAVYTPVFASIRSSLTLSK
jgi:hypothetical protein